jgi:hypothetical protein
MKLFQVLLVVVSLCSPSTTVAVNTAAAAAVDTDDGPISSTASITLRNDKSSSKCSTDNLELVCDALTASIKSHWNEYLTRHNKQNVQITDLDMKCSMGWDASGGFTDIPSLDYVQEVVSHALQTAGNAILQQGIETSYLFKLVLANYHSDAAPALDDAFTRRQLRGAVEEKVSIKEDMKSVISDQVTKDFQELIRTKTVSPCKESFSGWRVDFEWL